MTSDPEYMESLEKENEELRLQLRRAYYRRSFDRYTGTDDGSQTCDSVGQSGGCGLNCPVFRRGNCDIADEVLDELRDILDLYEDKDETDKT